MISIFKQSPAPDYPPEEGCYLRGNDYSPVAIAVILRWIREQTPPEIEHLVRVGVESGAALCGTLQTENIGLEKVISNVVANPNIRYLVAFGPESPGHLVGDAILALARNGIDENRRIIGAAARTPYLFNLPAEHVERFRRQVTVINLVNEGSAAVLREVIVACYQEQPTVFRDLKLQDPGAWPDPPLRGKLTWRVTQPEKEPKNEEERAAVGRIQEFMNRVRKATIEKKGRTGGHTTGQMRIRDGQIED